MKILLLLVLLTGCVDALGPIGDQKELSEQALAFSLLVDAHRNKIGCRPTYNHEPLRVVAQTYAEEMVQQGFFGHRDPEGRGPWDRVRAAGIPFRRLGENLARGQPNAEVAFRQMMDSASHRAVIENCLFTHRGIGYAERHWVLLHLGP